MNLQEQILKQQIKSLLVEQGQALETLDIERARELGRLVRSKQQQLAQLRRPHRIDEVS